MDFAKLSEVSSRMGVASSARVACLLLRFIADPKVSPMRHARRLSAASLTRYLRWSRKKNAPSCSPCCNNRFPVCFANASKIADRGRVGREDAQHLAAAHVVEGFLGAQDRQRAVRAPRIDFPIKMNNRFHTETLTRER